MKPSNPSISSLRRTLIAATAVLATGSIAAFAQSSSSSQGSSSSPGSSNYGSSSGSSSYGSTGSSSYGSSSGSANSSSSSTGMTGMSSSSSSSGKLSWSDRRFVTKAAEDGQDELQLAQLASQKASNPDVRNYAQQLVQQHQQVNSELMSIANQRNVKLDKDESNTRAYKRLNKASSQEFDREFVDHMIDEHEKDIKLFQKAASDAKDPQVREFASKHVADLQQHLQMAQQLQQSVIPTGESSSRSGQSYRGTSGSSSSSTSSISSTDSTTSGGTGSSSSSYGSGSSSSGSSSTSP